MNTTELVLDLASRNGTGERLTYARWQSVTADLQPGERLTAFTDLPEPIMAALLQDVVEQGADSDPR